MKRKPFVIDIDRSVDGRKDLFIQEETVIYFKKQNRISLVRRNFSKYCEFELGKKKKEIKTEINQHFILFEWLSCKAMNE